eukprot:1164087-Rhodomonas_salina.1
MREGEEVDDTVEVLRITRRCTCRFCSTKQVVVEAAALHCIFVSSAKENRQQQTQPRKSRAQAAAAGRTRSTQNT